MPWQLWFLINFQMLGVVMTVLSIGKERKPITPRVAVFGMAVTAWIIWVYIGLWRA